MKKIIFALIVVFILVGCKGDSSRKINPREFYSGTSGLIMDVLPMPNEIFEQSPLRMDIRLKNEGAADIDEGYLTLGLETDFISLNEWALRNPVVGTISKEQVEFELEGKSTLNPEGSQGIVAVSMSSKTIETMREEHTSTILLIGCYGYKTKLSEAVCIDTDILGMKAVEKACEVEDKNLNSQGAPIAVTKVEVSMLPQDDIIKPQFLIQIENKGGGEVVNSNVIRKACSGEPVSYEDFNVIKVDAYLFEKQLTCTPNDGSKTGLAKLKEKQDEIRCVLEEGIRKDVGTHAETLNVNLDYGYTETISRTIDIKKIPS
jgi:hypothetical protein